MVRSTIQSIIVSSLLCVRGLHQFIVWDYHRIKPKQIMYFPNLCRIDQVRGGKRGKSCHALTQQATYAKPLYVVCETAAPKIKKQENLCVTSKRGRAERAKSHRVTKQGPQAKSVVVLHV